MRAFLGRVLVGILVALALVQGLVGVAQQRRVAEVRARAADALLARAAATLPARLADPAFDLAGADDDIVEELGVRAAWAPLPGPPWSASAAVPLADGRVLHLAPDLPRAAPTELAWALLPALCVVALVAWALVRPLARDLDRLERDLARLGGDALDARVAVPAGGPVAGLAVATNDLAARVERTVLGQRDLFQSLSHALRTPHARLHFRVESLVEEPDPARRRAVGDAVERDLAEIDALLDELMAWLRADVEAPPPDLEPWQPDEVIAALAARLRPLRPEVPIVVRSSVAAGGTAGSGTVDEAAPRMAPPRVPRRWFERALENLVTNAQRHGKRVEVALRAVDDGLLVEVRDDGPGFPTGVGAPFDTRDGPRPGATGGVGLGLAVSRRILERAGGRLDLLHDGGALARTWWPSVAGGTPDRASR